MISKKKLFVFLKSSAKKLQKLEIKIKYLWFPISGSRCFLNISLSIFFKLINKYLFFLRKKIIYLNLFNYYIIKKN